MSSWNTCTNISPLPLNKRMLLEWIGSFFLQLTNCKRQRPCWEPDSRSPSQVIPCISWNLKFPYFLRNSSPLWPVLREMNLVHIFLPYFSKIHFNIILPSMLKYSKRFLAFRLYKKKKKTRVHFSCLWFTPCASPVPVLNDIPLYGFGNLLFRRQNYSICTYRFMSCWVRRNVKWAVNNFSLLLPLPVLVKWKITENFDVYNIFSISYVNLHKP